MMMVVDLCFIEIESVPPILVSKVQGDSGS